MAWYGKEQPTPFDTLPITGLEFLYGDALAKQSQMIWVEGKKYPLISFPSGIKREFRSTFQHENGAVYLFEAVSIGYHQTRDEALVEALNYAVKHGYLVSQIGDTELFLSNLRSGRGYRLTFDNEARELTNITLHPPEVMELLDGESRAILPPIYTNENVGLQAIAPVKFFSPDSHWKWYASEFDGNDSFFGLVAGFEVELGYFSLSELESVRGVLGLPVERDVYFRPQTLEALQRFHMKGRSG